MHTYMLIIMEVGRKRLCLLWRDVWWDEIGMVILIKWTAGRV